MNGKWKLRTVELPCEACLDDLERPHDRGSALPVLTTSRQNTEHDVDAQKRRYVILPLHRKIANLESQQRSSPWTLKNANK